MDPIQETDTPRLERPALTKIVATLGPASSDPDIIRRMIEAGVSVFRFNFSHGDEESHEARLRIVREVSEDLRRPVAVLGDLPGPKLRVGEVIDGGVEVETGAQVIFQREDICADGRERPYRFSSRYKYLVDDVNGGDRLLVNDGAIRMLVVDKDEDTITCTVTSGGLITTGKGINLPDTHLSIDVIGERDWRFARFAVANDIDYLALSFVREAEDIQKLRAGLERLADEEGMPDQFMPIVAKIEVPEALQNIDGILEEADGIMVARGDLGVEMDLAQVPVIQKQLIEKAKKHAKPCIVATQMLESMIESSTPTRAEASDVAGAIFDGTDAVMMSGETAVGKYPVLAVDYMRRIALATEEYITTLRHEQDLPSLPIQERYRTAVLTNGVAVIARDLHARFVVIWSQEGGGARHLSQCDMMIPILATSTDDRALRRMQLLRGVTPLRMLIPENLAHFTHMVDAYLVGTGWADDGDTCVLVAGGPVGVSKVTNSLAIHTIGDPETGFARHHDTAPQADAILQQHLENL